MNSNNPFNPQEETFFDGKSEEVSSKVGELLQETGITFAELKEWITTGIIPHSPEGSGISIPSYSEESPTQYPNDPFGRTERQLNRKSNITFIAGSHSDNSQILVDDTMITGVATAKLEYDSEVGFPVLQLQIINPTIKSL